MNLKKLLLYFSIFAISSITNGEYWGNYNFVTESGSYNWNTLQWVDSTGANLTGVPTIDDSVYLQMITTSTNINVTSDSYAKDIKIAPASGKTNTISIRIYGDAMLYVGNTGDLGGKIDTVSNTTGNSATPAWTLQSGIYFSSNSTTGV